jgi:nucleoid-associated protein YgaU
MGLFDAMIGQKAKESAQAPGAEARFASLKGKYQSVLNMIEQRQVRLENLHVENDKLFVKGIAPSEQVKAAIWEQVKLVDPGYSDLTLDLQAASSSSAAAGTTTSSTAETYTVKAGDSLSKIAQRYYGDAKAFTRIFEANRDVLNDPNMIQPGQQLKIPRA